VSEVHVLANPAARRGTGAARVAAVLEALRQAGARPVELAADDRETACRSLAELAAGGQGRVVLIGGDGLVHLALQQLATTAVELAIVPAGTGNDFAHALGLDRGDLAARVARALAPARTLDAIRTTHGWVASVAGIGFSAMVNARANRLAWPRGAARYTVATVAELPRLRPISLTLELDGVALAVDTVMLAVANTPCFGGGMQIAPDARPDDGILDVAVIGPVAAHTLLRVFPRVFRGTHTRHPQCTMYRARHVRLLDTTAELWGDGERLGEAPLELEAVPGAIRVAGA
jgi:diacylglycerol kinase (ATP)